MKFSRLLFTPKALSVALIAATCLLSSMTGFAEMSVAQSSRKSYKCQSSQGVYKTVSINAATGKTTEFIAWNPRGLGGYSGYERCVKVSARIQELYDSGRFVYITNGIVNKQNVICGLASEKDGCFERNMMYTLRPGDDPKLKVESLYKVATGRVRSLIFETEGRVYLDVEKYLDLLDSSEIDPNQILSF